MAHSPAALLRTGHHHKIADQIRLCQQRRNHQGGLLKLLCRSTSGALRCSSIMCSVNLVSCSIFCSKNTASHLRCGSRPLQLQPTLETAAKSSVWLRRRLPKLAVSDPPFDHDAEFNVYLDSTLCRIQSSC